MSAREAQVAAYLAHRSLADCDKAMRSTPGWTACPGPDWTWTCSCGRVYVHICDEAEGCYWVPESNPEWSV